ncbi:phosphoglycerate dehydrogenase-like oxidoreductase [Pseudarthrobacter phenanthrenivorans Sphe3]|uniref:Phosphoglycerate dehydrogenase-like oxidoreductase n=1 Tax=Pseudarthrobacter phenanthrenivorans (strain DSM 18606 / JCM 16027 / LMG 23796 / Sphe3) TaxID=930171 RepID=F0MAY7_PSEPM|nr:D-2-hydroxyacid dehydrogenase family protein [Pseudarthrobacter phenanthrenivorans]ADX71814.1 phosphoglycerate dehydrogenase-like oxidoreductase [Pseudarthrobacter phenanthrenivorans Sphe3]
MQHRLAILDDYQDVAHGFADWAALEAEGVTVATFREPFPTAEALVSALADVTMVIAMRERTAFPREVLAKLPALQLLVTTGMANASIDVAAAAEQGITVCGTPGSPTAAPELTWALLLAIARNVPAEENSLRAGTWQTTVGFELAGKTLGIVGLGKIGRRIAGYGQAFGMEVLAWSQNLTAEAAEEAGARRVSKEELFRLSDVATLHLRLSERSENTVGEQELRLLGPEGILVNTARGPLVDQDALLKALTEGWIRGAALDVFDQEPLQAGHPLLAAPNTVLSPHLGYVTRESYRQFYGGAFEDVTAWLAGTPVRVITP